jgi:Superfamily I DNA and RNA helicases
MTMHSAKGLEFHDVHIIECVDGVIPHKKSKTEAELEEERRMLYVAVTRTMDTLYMYSPISAGEKSLKVSRFLKGIADEKNNL